MNGRLLREGAPFSARAARAPDAFCGFIAGPHSLEPRRTPPLTAKGCPLPPLNRPMEGFDASPDALALVATLTEQNFTQAICTLMSINSSTPLDPNTACCSSVPAK
jgi:hypothetical protein